MREKMMKPPTAATTTAKLPKTPPRMEALREPESAAAPAEGAGMRVCDQDRVSGVVVDFGTWVRGFTWTGSDGCDVTDTMLEWTETWASTRARVRPMRQSKTFLGLMAVLDNQLEAS
jgi:hypothetical protein